MSAVALADFGNDVLCRAKISQINPSPTSLTRLVKNACENFVGKFRTKDAESSHLWIHHGFGEGRSKHLGLLGPATQRLGQRPDEAGILLERLNLNAHKTSRRRATTVRTGRVALGLASQRSFSSRRDLIPVI